MSHRRSAGFAVLCLVIFGITGCGEGAQSNDSRALVPADHLQQQQARLEQLRTRVKVPPTAKVARRRSIGA